MGFAAVAFGEALWDLLPTGPVLGGAPLNFAYRVKSLGNASTIVSRLGKDDLGVKAHEHLVNLGMDVTGLQWDDIHPTGTVEIFFDQDKNPNYTIIESVAYDYIESRDALGRVIENADCLCFGTLAQREPISRQTLRRLLSGFSGRFTLLDVNLRKNCYSVDILKNSLEQANIVKLNDEELAELTVLIGLQGDSTPDQAEGLLEYAGLEYCIVTLGERGAFALSRRGEKIYSPGYQVRLADPCGAGDGFAAGFIHALFERGSLKHACRFGNALGALVAHQEGTTQPISYSETVAFMKTGPPGHVDKSLKIWLEQ